MSELNSTLDDQYFFLASEYSGLVLEISTGKKGGDLVLSEARGKSSQLWRWDEDRRLVSKLGWVADIKGKNKKAGTVCHAWKAHDGLNQKWFFEDGAIKSDLNNLVIDAGTQPASMYEVDGSSSQKWYFVPENAWPDGRLVVLSIKYFFIASQKNGLVLDISTGKKDGNLVLSKAHGKPSQLWRWDEECRLVSKLGLVADIKGKKKKAGTVCHAWDAHDGFNQKWRVEEGAIKSSLNDLVIDASYARQPVTMEVAKEGASTQKWYFVPEKALDDFKLVHANPNPLNKAQFWKNLADNYLDVIIGYSIDDYEDKLRKSLKIIDECSSQLDKVAKDTGIAETVGGGVGIGGGVMAIGGLLLAPFTFGASLGLTAAGAAVGAAGGVTTLTGNLVNQAWEKGEAKKFKKSTVPLFGATFSLQGFLSEYIKNLREAAEFLKTPEGEAVARDAYTVAEVTRDAGKIAAKAAVIGNMVYQRVQNVKQAKQIKALVDFIQADYYALNGARIGLATEAAAPGITIPLLGKVVVSAGTTSAKVLSSSLAVFGIAFGIWDVVGGAKKIKNGSELAKEFRKSSKDLQSESAKLIKLYKELR